MAKKMTNQNEDLKSQETISQTNSEDAPQSINAETSNGKKGEDINAATTPVKEGDDINEGTEGGETPPAVTEEEDVPKEHPEQILSQFCQITQLSRDKNRVTVAGFMRVGRFVMLRKAINLIKAEIKPGSQALVHVHTIEKPVNISAGDEACAMAVWSMLNRFGTGARFTINYEVK